MTASVANDFTSLLRAAVVLLTVYCDTLMQYLCFFLIDYIATFTYFSALTMTLLSVSPKHATPDI